MIRPKAMEFVRIIGSNRTIENVIETLYDMSMLHLVDFKKPEKDFMDIGTPLKKAPIYSEQLLKARSMISFFGAHGEPRHISRFGAAKKRFAVLERRFRHLVDDLDKLRAEEAKLEELSNHPLAVLDIEANELAGLSSVKAFVGKVSEPLEEKLKAALKDYQLIQKVQGKMFSIALIVRNEEAEKAQEMLSSAKFAQFPMTEGVDFTAISKKLSQVRTKRAQAEKALALIKNKNAGFLIDYEFALSQLSEKAEAPLRFASTKNTFVASGWIPKGEYQKLKAALSDVTDNKVEVETLESNLEPPTVLENVKPATPFEFFLDLYSLPKTYEIDPTILMFLVYPLFFGFMLGDVGYGITTLAVLFLVAPKFGRGFIPLRNIMITASIATIVFGFVFGEFFGYEFIKNPLLNRVEGVDTMLGITIAVGVVHLTLGLLLGFINAYAKHGLKHAVLAKGAWFVLEAGVGMIAYGFLTGNTSLQIPGGIFALAAVAMLFKGEGIVGVMEVPTLFSNILSYTRLYAVGLASVALALIINQMTGQLISMGGVWIVMGIGILLAGHLLNFLLGLIGSFLQSLRLHYVEFFTKFYEGGGYYYNPFGALRTKGR